MLHPNHPNPSFTEKDEGGLTPRGISKDQYETFTGKDRKDLVIENLMSVIKNFVVKSNGLSVWVRMDHGDVIPDSLKRDLKELYKYQCHVEDQFDVFGLNHIKQEGIRNEKSIQT
jgi:hypothetical protein